MNFRENGLLLDASIMLSGAGGFILTNMELIVAAMVAFLTFVVTSLMRRSKHRKEMQKLEQQMALDRQKMEQKMRFEKDKNAQDLLQDQERHELEMDLLRQKIRKLENE